MLHTCTCTLMDTIIVIISKYKYEVHVHACTCVKTSSCPTMCSRVAASLGETDKGSRGTVEGSSPSCPSEGECEVCG